MFSRLHVKRLSWSLVDQGIVSGGTFVLNVLLARQLPASEYGAFALLLGGMLTLQLFNGMLLFHPLSVRLPLAEGAERARLLRVTLVLVGLLTAALGLLLAAVVAHAGRPDLALPSLICFLLWQLQEGMRRGLICTFRFRAATLGDGLSYGGQMALVLALGVGGGLTVEIALYAMAATSGVAALLQFVQLGIRPRGPLGLRATIADYWAIGGFWSLGNGLLVHGRMQLVFWLLAATAGAAEVAAYQAAQNIVNLMNPLLIGLCNVVPQAASQASAQGLPAAWRAARGYALLALPPVVGYVAVLLAVPGLALTLVYGQASPYLDQALAVRILALTALVSYGADFVGAFLFGINAARRAFLTSAVGAGVTAVLAVPLIIGFGLLGTCVLGLLTGIARVAASWVILGRLLGRGGDRHGLAARRPGLAGGTG